MHVALEPSIMAGIAYNLRPRDWDEIAAVSDISRDVWADCICEGSHGVDYERIWINSDGIAVAAGGFRPIGDRKWTAWLVGTPELPSCGAEMHAFAFRTMATLIRGGVKRIAAVGIDGYDLGSRWLKRLGFSCEGVSPFAGVNDENIAMWGWVQGMPGPRGNKYV